MSYPHTHYSPLSGDITLSGFFKIIREGLSFIILIILLGVLTTIGITLILPKWYKAKTVVRLEVPKSEYSLFLPEGRGTYYDPSFIRGQAEIIKSKKVLMPVIRDEEIQFKKFLNERSGPPLPEEAMYSYLANKMLHIGLSPSTYIIEISVMAQEDPIMAANLANAIAKYYDKSREEFSIKTQEIAFQRIERALEEQEEKVNQLRDKREKIRKELGITDTEKVALPSLDYENIRHMESQKVLLEVDATAYKTRWEQFKTVPRKKWIDLINVETVPDVNIQNLLKDYLLQQQLYVKLKEYYGENHPEFISTKMVLETMRMQLLGLLEGFEKGLEIKYKEAQARVDGLQQKIQEAKEKQIDRSREKMRPWEESLKDLEKAESVLETLTVRLRQDQIDKQIPKRTIEILNKASYPLKHSRPNLFLNIFLSFVGSSLFAIGGVFFVEYFDTSLRSIEEIEKTLQIPIFGVVPKKEITVTKDNFNTFDAEPYRVIQTNLDLFLKEKKEHSIIVFQSAGPGEGKSTTLYNVALTLAIAKQKVLVIDSDIRRPSQHKLFKTSRSPGIIDYLDGKTSLEGLIKKTEFPNLDFIPSGKVHNAHFSFNILHDKKLFGMVKELAQSYDKVFMDSPPAIGISDASIFANRSDGVVFVIQYRRNPASMCLRAKEIIQSAGGNILGIVLNQVPCDGNEDYNYYTSNYAYYHKKRQPLEKNLKRKEPVTSKFDSFSLREDPSKNKKEPSKHIPLT
jgi:polysaccharide biosynthesis transport protein